MKNNEIMNLNLKKDILQAIVKRVSSEVVKQNWTYGEGGNGYSDIHGNSLDGVLFNYKGFLAAIEEAKFARKDRVSVSDKNQLVHDIRLSTAIMMKDEVLQNNENSYVDAVVNHRHEDLVLEALMMKAQVRGVSSITTRDSYMQALEGIKSRIVGVLSKIASRLDPEAALKSRKGALQDVEERVSLMTKKQTETYGDCGKAFCDVSGRPLAGTLFNYKSFLAELGEAMVVGKDNILVKDINQVGHEISVSTAMMMKDRLLASNEDWYVRGVVSGRISDSLLVDYIKDAETKGSAPITSRQSYKKQLDDVEVQLIHLKQKDMTADSSSFLESRGEALETVDRRVSGETGKVDWTYGDGGAGYFDIHDHSLDGVLFNYKCFSAALEAAKAAGNGNIKVRDINQVEYEISVSSAVMMKDTILKRNEDSYVRSVVEGRQTDPVLLEFINDAQMRGSAPITSRQSYKKQLDEIQIKLLGLEREDAINQANDTRGEMKK